VAAPSGAEEAGAAPTEKSAAAASEPVAVPMDVEEQPLEKSVDESLAPGAAGEAGEAPSEKSAAAEPEPAANTGPTALNVPQFMGMHGALWRINPDRAGVIFGCNSSDGDNNNNNNGGGGNEDGDSTSSLNEKLSRAMIRSVTILESNTNIEEIVSIQVDGLPPKEFTANGDGASCFLTGQGKVTQPQEIFNMTGNTELGLAWMKQFPKYTSANLESVGVMILPGASYYFVHIEHPAMYMLKENESELGVHISQEAFISGGDWYQVDIAAFTYVVKMLREGVLQNTPSTFNLAGLTVRIGKPDGQRWLQIGSHLVDSLISDEVRESGDSDLISEARKQGVQRYIDKPLFVTLRMSFEYSLPEAAASSTANNTMVAVSSSVKFGNNNGVCIVGSSSGSGIGICNPMVSNNSSNNNNNVNNNAMR
jgi:hypothetical protein